MALEAGELCFSLSVDFSNPRQNKYRHANLDKFLIIDVELVEIYESLSSDGLLNRYNNRTLLLTHECSNTSSMKFEGASLSYDKEIKSSVCYSNSAKLIINGLQRQPNNTHIELSIS